MTELFTAAERNDRLVGVDCVKQEVRQFKKLQHLSDPDIAHRMIKTPNEVRRYRREFHQLGISLKTLGISYEVRVLLGAYSIHNTDTLFPYSDRALLKLSGIGPVRVAHIREKLREYFQ